MIDGDVIEIQSNLENIILIIMILFFQKSKNQLS